jgi:hypothetical protein
MKTDFKMICLECRWHGLGWNVLKAPNPFDPEDEILGCPKCKEVNSMVAACDEFDCWEEGSCGTPTLKGYRWTCFRHIPTQNTLERADGALESEEGVI